MPFKSVYVDAQGQIGGIATTLVQWQRNKWREPRSTMSEFHPRVRMILTVDVKPIGAINVATGINSDTLTPAGTQASKYTQQKNLTGNLGSGEDTVIVQGTVADGSDLPALAGVETIALEGMSRQAARKKWRSHDTISKLAMQQPLI